MHDEGFEKKGEKQGYGFVMIGGHVDMKNETWTFKFMCLENSYAR